MLYHLPRNNGTQLVSWIIVAADCPKVLGCGSLGSGSLGGGILLGSVNSLIFSAKSSLTKNGTQLVSWIIVIADHPEALVVTVGAGSYLLHLLLRFVDTWYCNTVISLTYNGTKLVSWIIVVADRPEVIGYRGLGSGGLGGDCGSGIVLAAHLRWRRPHVGHGLKRLLLLLHHNKSLLIKSINTISQIKLYLALYFIKHKTL